MEKIYSKTNLRQKLKKFLIMTVFIFGLDGKIWIENLKQREDNVFLEVFRSFGAIWKLRDSISQKDRFSTRFEFVGSDQKALKSTTLFWL